MIIFDLMVILILGAFVMLMTGGDLTPLWLMRGIIGFFLATVVASVTNGRFSYFFWWCILAMWLTTASWFRRRKPIRYPLRAHAFRRDRHRRLGWERDDSYYVRHDYGGEP